MTGDRRDPAAVAEGLTRWFVTGHPEAVEVRIDPPTRPSAGLSSETLLVELSWRDGDGAHHQSLVARLAPAGEGLFPTYDLRAQALVQERLGATVVPVAAPVAMEEDVGWLGTPFLLMKRIPGRVLLDHPPFLTGGWLHGCGPEDQRALHAQFLDVLAAIHRLDWAGLGLQGLARGTGLGGELDWWSRYVRWASGDAPPQVVADALAWCAANRPRPEPPACLLWGDVRFGNVIFDESLRPRAVLDWEMASIGPAEVDVGWFLAMHAESVATVGTDLPGFPDASATTAAYETRLGRALVDLEWYEVFALVRAAAIMVRMARLLVAQGISDSWLSGNPMLARLRKRLG
jgi:aminoglycoside phosphotransferase (APT) family kinase protein